MDHQDAIRTDAVERYLLDEMTDEEKLGFEEHYFDCPACARELHTAEIFVANLREHLRENPEDGRARGAWSAGPLKAVAAGVLFFAVGLGTYQSLVVIPGLEAPRSLQSVTLRGPTRAEAPSVTVVADKPLALTIDKLAEWDYPRYSVECRDGSVLKWTTDLTDPGPGLGLSLGVPTGLAPGRYSLTLYGVNSDGRSELRVYQLISSEG